MNRENLNIEELFRSELKDFRTEPSPSVWKNVRKTLFRKQFFRFNPGNMNIYYLGSIILLSGTLLALFLNQPQTEKPAGNKIEEEKSSITDTLSLPTEKQVRDAAAKESTQQQRINEGHSQSVKRSIEQESSRSVQVDTSQGIENAATKEKEKSIHHPENNVTIPVLQPSPITFFTVNNQEGCAPLKVSFNNLSENSDSRQWSFGDGGISTDKDPTYIYDEPGEYIVNLTSFGKNNTFGSHSTVISVYPKPEVRFEMDAEGRPGNGQPVYFYNLSKGASRYEWDFGDGSFSTQKDPEHTYKEPGNYNILLRAFSAEGCTDSMLIKNAFADKKPDLIFPNAFTPNRSGPTGGYYNQKDSNNDVFHPFTKETPEEYTLKIFNKKGILIFESREIGIGWDGYYRQELQPRGVYIWKVRARFNDGSLVVKIGDVTLL